MSITRRPNGRYAVQVYDPATRRMRQVGTFDTRREALDADVAAARDRGTRRETVESFQARWTTDFPRPRASTNRHNHERTTAFAKAHARRRLDSITTVDAKAWATANPSTLNAVRAMFSDARRAGLTPVNPFLTLGIKEARGRRDLPSEWLTARDVPASRRAAPERRLLPPYGPAGPQEREHPGPVGAQACAPVRTAQAARAGLSRDRLTGPQLKHSRAAVHGDLRACLTCWGGA